MHNSDNEYEWASSHMRDYHLRHMDEVTGQRFRAAVSANRKLILELLESEEALITAYLRHELVGRDLADFTAKYINGHEGDQIKVRVQRSFYLSGGELLSHAVSLGRSMMAAVAPKQPVKFSQHPVQWLRQHLRH